MEPRPRSRSPRRGGEHAFSTLPLADLLLHLQVLDDTSVDYLKKVPLAIAAEVLLAIGPGVRNPSAFVTNKLAGYTRTAGLQAGASRNPAPPLQQPLANPMASLIHSAAHAPYAPPMPVETMQIVHNSVVFTLEWSTKELAAAQLLQWGILDEGSADFLAKAPDRAAHDVVASLGPAVRNPSAFVTTKLKEVAANGWTSLNGGGSMHELPRGPTEVIDVFYSGAYRPLMWQTRDQAVAELVSMGVIDGVSADFLLKATPEQAKAVIQSLGPDVRNPSAFVTKKLNQLKGSGGDVPQSFLNEMPQTRPPLQQPMVHQHHFQPIEHMGLNGPEVSFPGGSGDLVVVHYNGQQFPLEWHSKEQAVAQLKIWGVLDEGCADFLLKAPENAARDIIGSLGPDVRNPSALVTNKMKQLAAQGMVSTLGMSQDLASAAGVSSYHAAKGGLGGSQPMLEHNFPHLNAEVLSIYHNGQRLQLEWSGKDQAVAHLVSWGVLDEGSADFLMKASEAEAKEVIANLGPDVRNPSAFVTRKLKGRQQGAW